jgi:hypothetical protein
MESKEVEGVKVGGRNPKALLLSDGSRLALEDDVGPGGRADWARVGDDGADGNGITVSEAVSLAGDEYAEYVKVRTRSEVAWLRLVSEWFDEEAARLDRELAAT